jgi:hypothetical protein
VAQLVWLLTRNEAIDASARDAMRRGKCREFDEISHLLEKHPISPFRISVVDAHRPVATSSCSKVQWLIGMA